ncbi:unnamed protein product (macronuclear) [Paramecium tetraurelia]|uniref:Protein kinase domain-containing protein n=1 Tax=Paramecium tetraurelia TaxID=5888 RepID=A0CYI7_PARTE|nr:uncharacterized protein GSPATT00011454001 [Paramecium tetraurelia]CAK75854.1 unnamed protein product [Paramecium tetraurelia]|eukprot:XP_001443251.1 hypothetical protein (macronuclear) [Paramecium tetraurelia strain d4-2]
MGNCNVLGQKEEFQEAMQSIRNYEILEVLGKGGFGRVLKVRRKKNNQLFAIKKMSKAKIINQKSITAILNEKNLLIQLRHPFIVNMHSAFQDKENLYLVLDLLTGGDLRCHIYRNKRFSEQEVKFFAACIITSLDYLHQQGIIHRDLKPENLVFDDKGYLRLTDMGIARIWRPENSSDISGTPGYMAPEVICRQNHGISVDFFALGVIVYECMLGKRPYVGKTRQEIREQILGQQVQVKRMDLPVACNSNLQYQLIQRKPINRLGTQNPNDVKNHPWFSQFDWNLLSKKIMLAPYKPKSVSKSSSSFDSIETPQDDNYAILRNKTLNEQFNQYCYDPESCMQK